MVLHKRNYCKMPTEEEQLEYEKILKMEKNNRNGFGRKNLRKMYPKAIRHYNSWFPNNHIELLDYKKANIRAIIDEFKMIVHDKTTKEQDVLRFINHKPAPYIVGSLFSYYNFGHHDAYIFPEFSLGKEYRVDYLLVGKNSGGYEFILVELEAVHGRTTLKSGHLGMATRKGLNQIEDWQSFVESHFEDVKKEFQKYSKQGSTLPKEFGEYDATRFHYMIISGLQDDCSEKYYKIRRKMEKERGISIYHYDNLIAKAYELENRDAF